MGIILKQARIKYMNSEKINTPPKRGKGGTGPCGLVPECKSSNFYNTKLQFYEKKIKKILEVEAVLENISETDELVSI